MCRSIRQLRGEEPASDEEIRTTVIPSQRSAVEPAVYEGTIGSAAPNMVLTSDDSVLLRRARCRGRKTPFPQGLSLLAP